MKSPLMSVIVPAYNQAAFLGEAIQSILDQSYEDLEVIVVDDCSPDNTAEVVAAFDDRRLRYIHHDTNRMLAAARNTGLRAARGDLFALLDADDYFATDKLAQHVAFLQDNPMVGVSYNNRYDLNCHSRTPRSIARVPATVTLADLVLGFPFTPSDMVLRRQWAFAVDLFDESFVHFSEDLDINCRLALAGCRMSGIDRCLNYRRMHAGRAIRNCRQRLEASLRSLAATFADVRTPPAVQALRGRAYANNYTVWGTQALRQGDTALGVEFLTAAVEHLPSVLAGQPNELTSFFLYEAIHDEKEDHASLYRNIVQQLPDMFAPVIAQAAWGIARGWLIKAYRNLLWGDVQEGRNCLVEAGRAGARCDKSYMDEVVYQLLGVEIEEGAATADEWAQRLDRVWRSVPAAPPAPSFVAALELGRVYEYSYRGRYAEVPSQVSRAMRANPRLAFNRSLLAIWMRSLRSSSAADGGQAVRRAAQGTR